MRDGWEDDGRKRAVADANNVQMQSLGRTWGTGRAPERRGYAVIAEGVWENSRRCQRAKCFWMKKHRDVAVYGVDEVV